MSATGTVNVSSTATSGGHTMTETSELSNESVGKGAEDTTDADGADGTLKLETVDDKKSDHDEHDSDKGDDDKGDDDKGDDRGDDKGDDKGDDRGDDKGDDDKGDNVKGDDDTGDDATGDDNKESDENEVEEKDWEKEISGIPLIPGYKKVDFENFKNYYGDFKRHAIEALIIGPQFSHEMRDEVLRRRRVMRTGEKVSIESPDSWIQRVRIQSRAILLHLENAAGIGEDWDRKYPRTFFRPFRLLICTHPRMKQTLQILEEKWGEAERLESLQLTPDSENDAQTKGSEAKDANDDAEKTAPKPAATVPAEDELYFEEDEEYKRTRFSGPNMDSVEALRQIRGYVAFVDKEILPLYHMFEMTSKTKVRFNDLWYLFRAGETVYSADTEVTKRSKRPAFHSPTYQTTWRVRSTQSDAITDDKPDDIGNSKRTFVVNCYYIDFDGDSYGAVNHSLTIKYFEGEKDITRLNVYPIRFIENSEAVLDRLKERGRKFQSYIKTRHLAYQGWNLISTPTGEPIGDKSHLEHIESNVIVDFVEGFQHFSSHKPTLNTASDEETRWRRGDDTFEIRYWSDASRTDCVLRVTEDVQLVEGVADFQRPPRVKSKLDTVEEDDLVLLPRRLVAYVLRERRFSMLDIESLSPIKQQKDIFSSLKINPSHKRLVKSLTRAHFMKQEALKKGANLTMNQDIVRGKGLGLTILLHGVPGVGKTATAEAVAQTNGKPLFVITCGDLGTTPTAVEDSLSGIFRLAHLWDCVLLLDEADIFLSKRETSNLQRNALVSVFLRVLEYYSGILFLTTNRVGTLDEAFKSRVHISLYYEPLKRQQTLNIFQVNISKLVDIETERRGTLQGAELSESMLKIDSESILDYAKWYFDNSHPSDRWNGRQIRNAFQVASSLVYYDMNKAMLEGDDDDDDEDDKAALQRQTPVGARPTPSTLNWWQFNLVADTIHRFSTYMNETTNGTPDDNAQIDGLRAHDSSYKSRLKAASPMYIPPELRQQPGMQHGGPSPRGNMQFHENGPQTPSHQQGFGRGRGGGFPHSRNPNNYSGRGPSRSPGVTESPRNMVFDNYAYEESSQYYGAGGEFQGRTNNHFEGHASGHEAAEEDEFC